MAKKNKGKKSGQPANAAMESRKAAIANMPERLFKKFDELETAFNAMQSDNIRYYYNIGKIAIDIEEKPEDYTGRDGTAGMELVFQAMSARRRLLRACCQAAREFTTDQITELCDATNRFNNFQLHWGHITVLLTRPTWGARLAWSRRAIANSWDPKELHTQMQAEEGPRVANPHGRRHELPQGVLDQLRQITRTTQTWLDKYKSVWNGNKTSVFGNVCATKIESLTPEVLAELRKLSEQLGDLGSAITEMGVAVTNTTEYVAAGLAQHEAATVAKKASAARHRAIEV